MVENIHTRHENPTRGELSAPDGEHGEFQNISDKPLLFEWIIHIFCHKNIIFNDFPCLKLWNIESLKNSWFSPFFDRKTHFFVGIFCPFFMAARRALWNYQRMNWEVEFKMHMMQKCCPWFLSTFQQIWPIVHWRHFLFFYFAKI